jgi:ribosomal-protein-alanine N-acetyltransferase
MNEQVFKSFPVLETERLILRQLVAEDVPLMFENYSNPELMRYWGAPPMRVIDEAWRRFNKLNNAYYLHQGIHWVITKKGQAQLIGICNLSPIHVQHSRAELGYDLTPSYWGQGIIPEAAGAVVAVAFEQMALHSLEAQIDPRNIASQRVLEKLGFRQEGYFRENMCIAGEFSDTAVFSLLRSEWQAS